VAKRENTQVPQINKSCLACGQAGKYTNSTNQ